MKKAKTYLPLSLCLAINLALGAQANAGETGATLSLAEACGKSMISEILQESKDSGCRLESIDKIVPPKSDDARRDIAMISMQSATSVDSMDSMDSTGSTGSTGVMTSMSSADPVNDRIESLTKQILQKELELQKLNTHFRIETALVSPWRQRRVFLYGETSAACTETSLIASISARKQLLRSLKAARRFPKITNDPVETDDSPDSNNTLVSTSTAPKTSGRVHGRLVSANELQLTGQTIGATGDVLELGLNFIHYCAVRHRNFTPARYRTQVHQIASELDTLIRQRQLAISERNQRAAKPGVDREQQGLGLGLGHQLGQAQDQDLFRMRQGTAQQKSEQKSEQDSAPKHLPQQSASASQIRLQLESCEGKMLSDLRDLSMIDYLEYHAATERFWVLQNTAFMLDFAKNAVGVAGNIISIDGSHLRRPRFAGTAGVCSVITGGLVMLQPVVGRVTGNISGSAARRLVSKELVNVNVRTSDVFVSDRKRLAALQESASKAGVNAPGLTHRMSLYAEQEKLMDNMNTYFRNERKRAHNSLVENVTFASLVGPPRISNGITQIVGGWKYYNDNAGRERMYLAGNISYAYGTAINMLETARVQASEELRLYRLGKKHMKTKQRFQARLEALDRLESTVR